MSKPSLHPQALEHLEETAARYREAFIEVQQILAGCELDPIPSWTFAIDRLSLDKVAQLSPELAEAEKRRRAWRTALFALTELLALDGSPEQAREGTGDTEHMGKLDRFITVVNGALEGGCIYLDGRFEPVRPGSPTPAPLVPDDLELELERVED